MSKKSKKLDKAVEQMDVETLKSLPSDQFTELVEKMLIALVENSKLKETFKAVLVQIIKEIENQINPDDGTASPVTEKKKWWKYLLDWAPAVIGFIFKIFASKKKK